MPNLRKKWKLKDKFINGLKSVGIFSVAVVNFIVGKTILILGSIIAPDINSENYKNEIHA